MRSLLVLLIGLISVCKVQAQSPKLPELEGCDFKLETQDSPGDIAFFAIKDEKNEGRGGQMVFRAGSPGWVYSWTYDGIIRTDGEMAPDSSYFRVPIPGNGVFQIIAEKEGTLDVIQSGEFRIFYVHIPKFTLSLHDIYNCEEIKLRIDNFTPAYFNDNGVPYYGPSRNEVEYLLSGRPSGWSFKDYAPSDWKISIRVDANSIDYTMTITDKFGLQWTSEPVRYNSVIPDAKMSLTLLNRVKVEGYGDGQGQAPLEVEFRDESENVGQNGQYEWYLYKDTADLKNTFFTLTDSLIGEQIRHEKDFNYTYEHPGQYKVQLKVINMEGPNHCWDTTEVEYVDVVLSLVNVPNVFTPNGDGINDVFKAQTLSVEYFHAVILNRWGRKVYEWNNPEGGWDGRIHGKYASPGTYYYIITARGRELQDPPKYVKKGAFLLVR